MKDPLEIHTEKLITSLWALVVRRTYTGQK